MKTFPFSIQHDCMQCGATCLQMICKFYGKDCSLAEISELCIATNEGVSLLGISEASTTLGFHTVSTLAIAEDLEEITLPCILHWDQNHFVVLYKIKKKKGKNIYYIADPGCGLIEYTQEAFLEHWISTIWHKEERGVVMSIEPTPSFSKRKKSPKDEQRSFSFLIGYIKQYKRYFGKILISLLFGCLVQLILPFLTQMIVDVGITQKQLNIIGLILLGQLVLTISRAISDFIRTRILLHISIRINISLVSDFLIKLLKLPMSFFETKLTGDLMERINDHKRVETFLTSQALSVTFSFFSFIVFGLILLYYDVIIFAVFFIGSLAYGFWISLFLKKRKVLDYQIFEKQADNNEKILQLLTSMQEIKLQDCEQRRRWEWEKIQTDLFGIRMNSLKLEQAQEAGCILVNEIKNIIITILAAMAVIQGSMTLGMMLAVQYIIGQLNSPVEQLMKFIYSVQNVKISLERINEIHLLHNEEDEKRTIQKFDSTTSIFLNHISFKYDIHSSTKTINDVDFEIPHGQVTAIVGASGSGKTTLIKLILGFYPVLEGSILVGNNNMNMINLKSWRKQCGVVMQEGVIFSESIARNIAVSDEDIDKEEMERSAEIANIKDFIDSLPLKYNTKIGPNGIGISNGQKQRILIARAVYKNPGYIFLDEATNALDAENEKLIVSNLNTFYKGRTVVVVAHRLSTVKNADHIIVLDKGKIAEQGTHDSLIQLKGAYFQLIRNQLELGN